MWSFLPQSYSSPDVTPLLSNGDLPKDQKFRSFDEKPIAAASIAQVHYGTLRNNQEVAIKLGITRYWSSENGYCHQSVTLIFNFLRNQLIFGYYIIGRFFAQQNYGKIAAGNRGKGMKKIKHRKTWTGEITSRNNNTEERHRKRLTRCIGGGMNTRDS
ncbi:hypothetical protein MA16_Dca008456 [Dendrobium catenatum]|uniref:ABC1 atypical kinase-like domain-containing protein n=1 Tax=Dendrobium catenatum TaxID=906689 RepID=A0A2I0XHI6_9ASPA|nr:hypothetical protein MA16_Dca008456 [Dendrobium catenatum]